MIRIEKIESRKGKVYAVVEMRDSEEDDFDFLGFVTDPPTLGAAPGPKTFGSQLAHTLKSNNPGTPVTSANSLLKYSTPSDNPATASQVVTEVTLSSSEDESEDDGTREVIENMNAALKEGNDPQFHHGDSDKESSSGASDEDCCGAGLLAKTGAMIRFDVLKETELTSNEVSGDDSDEGEPLSKRQKMSRSGTRYLENIFAFKTLDHCMGNIFGIDTHSANTYQQEITPAAVHTSKVDGGLIPSTFKVDNVHQ